MKNRFIVIFILLLSSISFAQKPLPQGIYWTEEDYKTGKLDATYHQTGWSKSFGAPLISFEDNSGKKKYLKLKEFTALRDDKGVIWRTDPENNNAWRMFIRGTMCFYGGYDADGSFDKDGKVVYMSESGYGYSKGPFAPIIAKAPDIKTLFEDDAEALELYKKGDKVDAVVLYNKHHPSEDEFMYPLKKRK